MQISELTISNIRGIRSMSLDLANDTAVVWGQNGTGKSTVVDALDFLLSGDMGRLRGRQDLSLQRHGKHVDAESHQAFVGASVTLPGVPEPIRLRRCLATPRTLEVDDEHRPALDSVLAVAQRRQHMLTRAEILQFIDATPRDRADAVESILNLQNIGRVRTALRRAFGDAEREHGQRITSLERSRGALGQHFGAIPFVQEVVIARVNEMRAVLGAQPLTELSDIKHGIAPPEFSHAPARPALTLEGIERMSASVEDDVLAVIDQADTELQPIVTDLQQDHDLLESVQRVGFLSTGLKYAEGSTICPLCDSTWDPEALSNHIAAKIDAAERAKAKQREVQRLTMQLNEWLGRQADVAEQVAASIDVAGDGFDTAPAKAFAANLRHLGEALEDVVGRYASFRSHGTSLADQLGIVAYHDWLARASSYAEQHQPTADPRRAAWDSLTRAEVLLGSVNEAKDEEAVAASVLRRAAGCLEAFQSARASVLGQLYSEVNGRFVELYKRLHDPEEAGFAADIGTTDAGVSLQVDFHGREMCSPMALHSEGHQDSMGLCLFLALSERVLSGRLGFRVLDDVVMSVDSGHRRHVAGLLAELGGNIQFIITTHDRVWASQLRSSGAVKTKRMTQLVNWSLEAGPLKQSVGDFWNDIDEHLSRGRLQAAAATLRNGLEGFLSLIAELLGARVLYSMEGRVEFGDLYMAVTEQQKAYIDKAIRAARSWQQNEVVEALQALDEQRKAARRLVNDEAWMVNPTVHFNSWNNLSVEEFRPVVDGYRQFCDTFKCPVCSSLLSVHREGMMAASVSCRCGRTVLNLRGRE